VAQGRESAQIILLCRLPTSSFPGAGVVADVEGAGADQVLAAGLGVADLVVAEDAVAAEVLDADLPG
jgi:hypothetical protein